MRPTKWKENSSELLSSAKNIMPPRARTCILKKFQTHETWPQFSWPQMSILDACYIYEMIENQLPIFKCFCNLFRTTILTRNEHDKQVCKMGLCSKFNIGTHIHQFHKELLQDGRFNALSPWKFFQSCLFAQVYVLLKQPPKMKKFENY